jgi:hypothetical protein
VYFSAKYGDIGQKILFSLIEEKPKFAEHFGIYSTSVSKKEMRDSRQLQLQAQRIQNFLNAIVESLGNCPISSVCNMAHHVGQIHYHQRINFDTATWMVFKRVTIVQVIKMASKGYGKKLNAREDFPTTSYDNRSPSPSPSPSSMLNPPKESLALIGWHRLMTIVIREMKRGFLEEAISNCQK